MPIEVGIWRIDNGLHKVGYLAMEAESKLEDTLAKDIAILSPGLMLIGRQVPTAHGKFIDLLAMDAEGNLSVVELKKHKTPREVVAQLLDYASWVQTLSYDDITEIYAERNEGEEFEQGFADAFDTNPPDKLNEQLQLIVVAAELDHASERIINYLADNYGVPINAVFFAADGGRWYTRTLETLSPGARVFVCIPKSGYVGVGKVVDIVKPAKDFTVEVDGKPVNIHDAPLKGGYMRGSVEDPEKCAYFVRVEWIKTLPREQAYWEKGMFANQNTVTKLRNRFTLERLSKYFDVDGE